jgi:Guanylate-binding protein, N-terminal domain
MDSIPTFEPEPVEEPEYGSPLPLMWLTETNHSIVVDYDKVTEIFNREEIADRKIVAISIIGALRKGKSFFLGYCLRYMYANVS